MLARLDPRVLDRVWFPLGEQTKAETRAQALAAGLAAAGRAESQEVCFLAGGDYRDFLARRGLDSTPGDIVAEDGTRLGRHDGCLALHARPAEGPRRRGARAALRAAGRAAHEHARGRAAALARDHARSMRAAGCSSPATRVEAKLRHGAPRRARQRSSRRAAGSASTSTSRPSAWPAGRPRSPTTATSSSGRASSPPPAD